VPFAVCDRCCTGMRENRRICFPKAETMTNLHQNDPSDPDTAGPGAAQPQPTATRYASLLAEARRQALRDLLRREGLTLTELARRAGMRRANALYNFLHGRSLSLSSRSLTAIRAALPHVDLTRLVTGNLGAPASEPPVHRLAVRHETAQPDSPKPEDPVDGRPDPRDARAAVIRQSLRRLEGEVAFLRHLLEDNDPNPAGDD
jgi:transcriptional regulator with XRE-family HTH domain